MATSSRSSRACTRRSTSPTSRWSTIALVSIPFCFFTLGQLVSWLIQVQVLLRFIWQCAAVILLRRYRPDIPQPFTMWLYPLARASLRRAVAVHLLHRAVGRHRFLVGVSCGIGRLAGIPGLFSKSDSGRPWVSHGRAPRKHECRISGCLNGVRLICPRVSVSSWLPFYSPFFPSASRFAVIRYAPARRTAAGGAARRRSRSSVPCRTSPSASRPAAAAGPCRRSRSSACRPRPTCVQNFEPRCSTQPSKSAAVIVFGQVKHWLRRREDRRPANLPPTLPRRARGSSPGNGANWFGTSSCVL